MTLMNFSEAYAHVRSQEGRELHGDLLKSLPYLRSGPLARQWAVRAASFDAFVQHVLTPREDGRALDILDLGAGNGWLSYRMARRGHRALALDMRDDMVDGLGAAVELTHDAPFECVVGSFTALPLGKRRFDIVLFNASLHYAKNLPDVLGEAVAVVRSGGVVVVMDSPFYARDRDGAEMVSEKCAHGEARFGTGADLLLSQGFIEYLTPQLLAAAIPGLRWARRRVRYPLWYELRPLVARFKGMRRPSRFDLWIASP
ncbi:MAG TPA: class I SAM-dependent methyltransferase [Rhizomicrobium sp.]|jgi:SAM-dependent methyltransferase